MIKGRFKRFLSVTLTLVFTIGLILVAWRNKPDAYQAQSENMLPDLASITRGTEDGRKVVTASWNGSAPVVIHDNYTIDMILDPEKRTYTAALTVDIYNDSADTWNEACFRDYPSAFADKENGALSEFSEVRNAVSGTELSLERSAEDNTVVTVYLDAPLKPGETTTITARYKASVPELAARFGFQSIEGGGTDFSLGNAFPVLCPYENGAFQSGKYFDYGECFYSRMANYEVRVTAPADYTVIATGDPAGESAEDASGLRSESFSADAVRDFALVIGNDFQKATGTVDGIEINSYYHEADSDNGQAALYFAEEAFQNYDSRLGKYPYARFNVALTKTDMMGMEYPELIMLTNDGTDGAMSAPHEILHQWFYSLLGNNEYAAPWIDESVTTYLCNRGLEDHSGIITEASGDYADANQYEERIYFCGASMYNRLEDERGTDTMNAFLGELLDQYAFREADTPGVVRLLVKYYGADDPVLKEYIAPEYLSAP